MISSIKLKTWPDGETTITIVDETTMASIAPLENYIANGKSMRDREKSIKQAIIEIVETYGR